MSASNYCMSELIEHDFSTCLNEERQSGKRLCQEGIILIVRYSLCH